MTYFNDADQAMRWATEVLRLRRFPKISGFYRECVGENGAKFRDSKDFLDWCGEREALPTDAEDRTVLALKVYVCFKVLRPEEQMLLKMHYWGDYYDDGHLQKALKGQEALRRQGIRSKLNYRYSFRQLGEKLGCGHSTVSRRISRALAVLEVELEGFGLMFDGTPPAPEIEAVRNSVQLLRAKSS